MLRISRTTPIAENEHFPTSSKRFGEKRPRSQNLICLLVKKRLLQSKAVPNCR